MRVIVAAALTVGFAASADAQKARQPRQCRGQDMLSELQGRDPSLHTQIMQAAATTENAEALLWRVERQGIAAPSYLLGTMHVTDPRVTSLSPKIKQALADAKTVMLEVADLTPEATAAAVARASAQILYIDGRRLDTQLDKAEFATVEKTIAAAGMPPETAALLRPWIVYMMLSVSECERRQVQEGNLVLDMRLAEQARVAGVPVVGLESIDEQLAAMSAVPEEQQLQVLRATLKYANRTDDLMETVLQLYLGRKMGAAVPFQMALARQAGVDPAPLVVYQRELVIKRNHNMLRAAEPNLAKGGALLAVGALHLIGKEGLVSLLRGAGYTVTPVE